MMLPETEQWNDLWENGKYLNHYIGAKEKCNLYALYDFFVEVELNPVSDKIIGKGHFKSGDTLDRYAGSIDINKV